MNKYIDLTGKRFEKLLVVKRYKNTTPVKFLCKCDCGNEIIAYSQKLRRGETTSCGCNSPFYPKQIIGNTIVVDVIAGMKLLLVGMLW